MIKNVTVRNIFIVSLLCTLSSCRLIDLGLAYIGYTLIAAVVGAVGTFLFSFLHGLTKSFGWSLLLTFLIMLFAMAIIFKW